MFGRSVVRFRDMPFMGTVKLETAPVNYKHIDVFVSSLTRFGWIPHT